MLATVLTWRNLTIYLSLNKALSINLSSSFSGIEIQSHHPSSDISGREIAISNRWALYTSMDSMSHFLSTTLKSFSIRAFAPRARFIKWTETINKHSARTFEPFKDPTPQYIYPSLTHPPHTHLDRTSRRNHATNPFGFIFRFAQTVQRRTNDSSRTPSTIPPTPTA